MYKAIRKKIRALYRLPARHPADTIHGHPVIVVDIFREDLVFWPTYHARTTENKRVIAANSRRIIQQKIKIAHLQVQAAYYLQTQQKSSLRCTCTEEVLQQKSFLMIQKAVLRGYCGLYVLRVILVLSGASICVLCGICSTRRVGIHSRVY